MRSQPPESSKKRIPVVYAVATAASGLMIPAVVAEASNHGHSNRPNAPSSSLHETLWGNGVWDDQVYTLDPSATLNIPRGGTDEPNNNNKSHKKDRKKKKQDNKKDTKNDRNKDTTNKKKQAKDSSTTDKKKKKKTKPKEQPAEETTATPSSNPVVEDILQKDDYYDILGLPRGEDNTAKIKKAYRRLCLQTHPDKTGGDRRAFDKLAEAYDVLLDDEKRAIYNRYGKDGLDPTRGGPTPSSAEDLFRSFFGGAPQQRGPPPVNRTVRYQLQVTLEELYQGKLKQVTVEAPRANTFYAQFEPPARKKQVEVHIPRGAQAGQSVVLSGEMDFDDPSQAPGDLIFQLHLRKHKTFTRKGHDLAMELTISLQDAIGGFTRRFQLLNGKYITVESAKHPVTLSDLEALDGEEEGEADEPPQQPANVYIRTGDVQVLKGKGMPKNPQGTEFGDLYIQYTVELPRAGSSSSSNLLTPEEQADLARLLNKLEGKPPLADSKSKSHSNHKKEAFYQLEPARASDFGRASGRVPDPTQEDYPHAPEEEQQFPFAGMGHRQFFFSSTGRSPFFGQQQNFEDDDNVQCRQM